MSLAVHQVASVHTVFVGLHLEIWVSYQLLVVYDIVVQWLVVQVLLKLFLVFDDDTFLFGVMARGQPSDIGHWINNSVSIEVVR